MKKTLTALAAMAALAAAGTAAAQSSVTVFGIVDASLTHGSGSVSSKTQLASGSYSASRLGFRGREDLGGGMWAGFWLEAGLNNDNGTGSAFGLNASTNNQANGCPAFPGSFCTGATAPNGTQGLTFNHRSTVSLGGNWGEVRLGRDFTPQFFNTSVFDPFGTRGVGTNQVNVTPITVTNGGTTVRASNTVGYFLPGNLGGFYGQFQAYLGENNSGLATSHDGRGAGLRAGYAAGPIDVAFGYGHTTYAKTAAAGNVRQMNVGGSYNFGMVKLMGQYESDKLDSAVPVTGKGWLIGALVPVGAGEIRLAYSRYKSDLVNLPAAVPPVTNGATALAVDHPTNKKLAVGYVHNLSKRTALYATFARLSNSGYMAGTATPSLAGSTSTGGGSSNGYDIGIRHTF